MLKEIEDDEKQDAKSRLFTQDEIRKLLKGSKEQVKVNEKQS
jgi:hypothetical protein